MACSGSPLLRVGLSYSSLYTQHICHCPLINSSWEELREGTLLT